MKAEAGVLHRCEWLNEPRVWAVEDGVLRVATDHGTDFWRQTHYGFTRDSGHFFRLDVAGDFTAQLRVQAGFRELYDQAGMMVRLDGANWLKAGVEFSDGRPMLGSVLTVGQSDWATGVFVGDPSDFWIRVTVANGVLRLQASSDGMVWPLSRLAPFPKFASYGVGPMCCTPEREGLEVRFSEFQVGPPLNRPLHDLS